MDDETRHYLDDMLKQLNDQFDRVLDSLSAIRQDSDDTKVTSFTASRKTSPSARV